MRYGVTIHVQEDITGIGFSVYLRGRKGDRDHWLPLDGLEWRTTSGRALDQRQWLKDRLVEVIEQL